MYILFSFIMFDRFFFFFFRILVDSEPLYANLFAPTNFPYNALDPTNACVIDWWTEKVILHTPRSLINTDI